MDTQRNIEFSDQEMQLMRDDQIFPQKLLITKKIYDLLSELSHELKNHTITQNYPFPEGTDITAGKISKGENYQQQPYAILDLPRKFSRQMILAYRTMFWWGHCFAFTLHVGGTPMKNTMQKFLSEYERLQGKNVYFAINSNQFEHHFGEDNYQLLDNLDHQTIRTHIETNQYFKVAKQMPLDQWHHLLEESVVNYELFMDAIREE